MTLDPGYLTGNPARIDHVAVLVEDLAGALAALEPFGLPMGAIGEYESEGTREAHVGEEGRPARLLLLEAIAEGPYARALAKRGPGLHHLGLAVGEPASLEAIRKQALSAGWKEHASSAAKGEARARWFQREGTGTLLEIFVSTTRSARPSPAVVESVVVFDAGASLPAEGEPGIPRLRGGGLGIAMEGRIVLGAETALTVAGQRFDPAAWGRRVVSPPRARG